MHHPSPDVAGGHLNQRIELSIIRMGEMLNMYTGIDITTPGQHIFMRLMSLNIYIFQFTI